MGHRLLHQFLIPLSPHSIVNHPSSVNESTFNRATQTWNLGDILDSLNLSFFPSPHLILSSPTASPLSFTFQIFLEFVPMPLASLLPRTLAHILTSHLLIGHPTSLLDPILPNQQTTVRGIFYKIQICKLDYVIFLLRIFQRLLLHGK